MEKRAISMMSGTSLDGIDIIMGEISGTGLETIVKVLYSATYSYDESLKNKIEDAISLDKSTSKLLCSLNYELAVAYSKCVFEFCDQFAIELKDIDFIACHGQTIYHISEDQQSFIQSSLQLGDGSVLANLTNTTVISNFRAADIAVGGQGAPLVPYADYLLFRDQHKTRLLQNIGGISNVTCISKNADIKDVFAFDNGPGNMMIDYAMKVLYNSPFDKEGAIAATGMLIQSMYDEILQHNYFKKLPPKSTGRETFGIDYTSSLLKKYKGFAKEDIITTLTHITAFTIAESYRRFISINIDEIIISGGGANNRTLLNLIQEYVKDVPVVTLESHGYSSDYKEALAFMILANETIHHNPSNVMQATGATRPVILGQVSYVLSELMK